MKKLIAVLMTVLFLGGTTGLVFAQGTAPASAPVKTTHKVKKSKKGKKSKKSTSTPAAASTTPAAK